MNSKDRVLTALRGGQPDRVPIVETPDLAALMNLAAALGIPNPGPGDAFPEQKLACRLLVELGLDAMFMPDPLDVMEHDGDTVRDRFGSVYRKSLQGEPYLIHGPVATLEDTIGLDMSSAVSPKDFEAVTLTRDSLGPERPVILWLLPRSSCHGVCAGECSTC